ncbi:MAG TPA: D-glycerate dehydrogenase [Candidatus Marinimicrobia bacterium]|nr:D-glycerate dehydrogenase [Candidatus Neomarinimicrobiota bacterium]
MKTLYITQKLPAAADIWLQKTALDREIFPEPHPIPREILLQKIKMADGLICMLSDAIDADLMDAAPKLKVICNYAVGTNNIDLEAARARNIIVCNTPGVLTHATAELTWALILAAARRLTESERFLRAGKFIGWQPTLLIGTELFGKTLGIIGSGRIGQRVAQIGHAFGMEILYSRSRNPDLEKACNAKLSEFGDILKNSDIISLHVPLTPENKRLITMRELKMMKSSAILINTARGPIVNEADLATALQQKIIAAAGLDVFEKEPLVHPGLLALENLVLLPHIGSATERARNAMAKMVIEDAAAVLNGQSPKNRVV